VLWTEGLRLYLPAWLNALALWAYVAAAIGWLPRRTWRSAGLALLLAGGMLLETTYQQSLALVAVILLTGKAAEETDDADLGPRWRIDVGTGPRAPSGCGGEDGSL